MEFELLSRWAEHKDAAGLIARVSAETPLAPDEDQVGGFIRFLAGNQLLRPDSNVAREELARRVQAGKTSWLSYLFHHYLFFRLPLLRPDGFLSRTVPLVEPFFTRGFLLLVLTVLAADLYLVGRSWHDFSNAFLAMATPTGLVYYGKIGRAHV